MPYCQIIRSVENYYILLIEGILNRDSIYNTVSMVIGLNEV
jgi:hypothetical protein